jgi:hypothetical protein
MKNLHLENNFCKVFVSSSFRRFSSSASVLPNYKSNKILCKQLKFATNKLSSFLINFNLINRINIWFFHTTIEILLSDFNDFEIRTSSENSSSEHSVDNDVVAANVNYTKNGTSVPRI